MIINKSLNHNNFYLFIFYTLQEYLRGLIYLQNVFDFAQSFI